MPHPISSRGTDAAGVTSAYIADSDEEYRRSPPPPYELVLMEEGAAGGAVVTERVRDLEVRCVHHIDIHHLRTDYVSDRPPKSLPLQ